VRIAPGMLADAVSDDHHGTRLAGGQPRPPVDLGPRGTGEEPLCVLLVRLIGR
jgi:hypothetical protein